ncbi:hypothetical protein ACWA1F_00675 [Flavobacterium sp. 3-218]
MPFIYPLNFHYKITSFYILTAFLCSFKITAQNDTLYFNQKWKNTSKDSAVFYRIKPFKVKTKDAIGYKIKNTDSLFVIKDYYINNNKLQFEGYSIDYEAKYLVGKAEWFTEIGNSDSRNFNYKENNNTTKFKIPEFLIFYIDYKIADKSLLTGGLEFCLNCKNENKLLLGIGYGITNSYNGNYYGLPDLHLFYNRELLFFKTGSSHKNAYALGGFTFFNVFDLGFGYSFPYQKESIPHFKGFTSSLSFRFSNNQKVYKKFNVMQ